MLNKPLRFFETLWEVKDSKQQQNLKIFLWTLKNNYKSINFDGYSWLARTDPADVARVESRTFVVTPERREAVPTCKEGVKGQLGNWMSPDDLQQTINDRFPKCMKGMNITWENNLHLIIKSTFEMIVVGVVIIIQLFNWFW